MSRPMLFLAALFALASACDCGAPAASADASAHAQAATTETARIQVEGMTCATCPLQVRAAMSRVDGVVEVQVSLRDALATVQYDPERATPAQIAAAATAIGYPATPAAGTATRR